MDQDNKSSDDQESKKQLIFDIVAQALRDPRSRLNLKRPLHDHGLDSLHFFEIRSQIFVLFDFQIQFDDVRRYSIEELASKIVNASKHGATPPKASLQIEPSDSLTAGQLAIWTEYERDRFSSAFHVGGAVQLDGICPDVAQRAIEAVFTSCPVLTTRFRRQGNYILREKLLASNLDFVQMDGSEWTELMVQERLEREWNSPFDLEQSNPCRIRLIRLGVDKSILLVAVHHIVCDFQSFVLLQRDFSTACETILNGQVPNLPRKSDLTDSYLSWCESYRKSEQEEADQRFWQSKTVNIPVIRWPESKKMEADYSGAVAHQQIDPTIVDRVATTAQSLKCTPFSIYYSAFAIALSVSTGQHEFCVGTPVTTRNIPEIDLDEAVGYFANTVMLRTVVDPTQTAEEFLSDVYDSVEEILTHSHYPCWSQSRTSEGKPAKPQVLFTCLGGVSRQHSVETNALQVGEVELGWGVWSTRVVPLTRSKCQCDMVVTIASTPEDSVLAIEYDSALMNRQFVESLGERFQIILRSILDSPRSPLYALDLLTSADVEILEKFNCTETEFPEPKLLHVLALEGITNGGGGVAIRHPANAISFEQGEVLSARVAGALRSKGVGSGDRVAVCCKPRPQMAFVLLGILRVGAAFVPVSTSAGNSWLESILTDIDPKVILVEDSGREQLKSNFELMTMDECLSSEVDERVESKIAPESPAYIIFTSGSTGPPKGVVVSHAAICNRLLWMKDQYPMTDVDCVLQKTPATFDVSVWEFFLPLISGVSQVSVPEQDHRDPEKLVQRIVETQATITHFVPSVLRPFLNEPSCVRCKSLRQVFCSGEALDGNLRDRFFSRFPNVELHNLYGPTEAAVDATYWQCSPSQNDDQVPIGRPIANLKAFVLDGNQKRVAPGVVGELFLAGAGLANGYWNQPKLTKERFIEWKDRGKPIRVYRTGDLAALGKNGVLNFAGRNDRQVKIGGERIELDAIESVLRGHPEISNCAVVSSDANSQSIQAFFVATKTKIDIDALIERVSQWLPSSHHPNQWIQLDSLPLTSSGKTDISALRNKLGNQPASLNSAAWSSEEEALVAKSMRKILNKNPSSPDSNFFELGGDSLRAIQLRSTLLESGYELPLDAIFKTPTLKSLASQLKIRSTEPESKLKPFDLLSNNSNLAHLKATYDNALPLSHVQQALLFHSQHSADYEIYVLRLSLRGKISQESFRQGLAKLASRHPMLRTGYELSNGKFIQCVHRAVEIPFEFVTHEGNTDVEREQAIATAVQNERRRKFDWSNPPLIRFRLDQGREDHFDLTVSHPVFDGWSLMVLLTELLSTVAAQEDEKLLASHLPTPKSDMADFVHAEHQGAVSAEHRRYWQSKLDQRSVAPVALRPSTHRLRHEVLLDQQTVEKLRSRANSEQIQFKTLLLSIHLAIEGYRGNTEYPATGLIVNGRAGDFDSDRAVGMFLNTVLVSARTAQHSWSSLAAAIASLEAELWPYRHFPFVELRQMAKGAPFESIFNFVHFHIVKDLVDDNDIKIVSWENPSDFTFFPLAVYFVDDPVSSQLMLYLDYDQDRYSTSFIERLGITYCSAIRNATIPDNQVAIDHELSLIEGGIQNQQRVEKPNDSLTQSLVTIPELIGKRAAQTPDSIAIVDAECQISYKELWDGVLKMTNALLRHGLAPEEPVALIASHSYKTVRDMLAIMVAGGAFIPVDPLDSRCIQIVKQSGIRFMSDAATDLQLVRVKPGNDTENRLPAQSLGSLAYIVSTSGSTGSPHLVEVEHAALRNTLISINQVIGATRQDHWLCVTPITFDISILERLLPLTVGASLTLADPADVRDGSRLKRMLEDTSWTFTQGTPSTFQLALEAGWTGSSSQRILCGGERLSRRLANRLLDSVGEVWNCYGPCEAAIWATVDRVTGGDESPSIGRPIANTWLGIMGANGEAAPAGTTGEIVLGGAGLARAYRNEPKLTEQRFPIKDGKRMYRTGDLGRLLETGKFEFIGRRDRQIKLRGFRIEPAEIEAVLLGHPSVVATAVTAQGHSDEELRLIAFCVCSSASKENDLRDYLHGTLPAVMIPAEFHFVAELPTTSHGKVDYQRLSELSVTSVERTFSSETQPQGELENCIAKIWCEILDRPNIGREQNFFSLGGHSLLVMQSCIRIQAETGCSFSPTLLFNAPTVASLAQQLSTGSQKTVDETVESAKERGVQRRKKSS